MQTVNKLPTMKPSFLNQTIKLNINRILKTRMNQIFLNENRSEDNIQNENIFQQQNNNIFLISKRKRTLFREIQKLFDQTQCNQIYQPLLHLNISFTNFKAKTETIPEQDDDNKTCLSNNETLSESIYNNNNTYYTKDIYTDPYSTFNKYNRDYIPNTYQGNERYKNKVPFLKDFNPKFLKKENIDKKIFRRFRNFVRDNYHNFINMCFEYDHPFWDEFCYRNLLPPMIYIHPKTGRRREFKSFNTKYFLWLFNKKGTYVLFSLFSQQQGNDVLDNFIREYKLREIKEDNVIEKLKTYIYSIPKIYSMNCLGTNEETFCEYDVFVGKGFENEDNDKNNRMNHLFDLNFNYDDTEEKMDNQYNWDY